MTRHGKNNTASPCYTYYERQRDAKNSGYGTQRQRLNKDSVKDFDACSLSLQPCKQPVVTKDGVLFDKEVVLEYIIQKKQDALRKLRQYEKQTQKEKREMAELAEAEERSRTEKFLKLERGITNPASAGSSSSSSSSVSTSTALALVPNLSDDIGSGNKNITVATSTSSFSSESKDNQTICNMTGDLGRKLPSFWIPMLTPQSKATKIKRPSMEVFCPITGTPLKAKDLIPIKFTPIDSNSKLSASQRDRYMCPVTHDILSNSIQCAVLKPSGNVVTMECVDKIIKKDMLDPLTGDSLKPEDIIPLQRGGTGYAQTNALVAEIKKPVMQV